MLVVLAGASGFLGTALRSHLVQHGHRVRRLVRSDPPDGDAVRWDPAAGRLDAAALDEADVVVNLGGAPIGRVPWTPSYRRTILESRLSTTGTLAAAVAGQPRPPALVNASGINYYGTDRGNETLDEDASAGTGFLAEVCRRWEEATRPASDAGARVVLLRTALVLHSSGGVLGVAKLPFKLGLGGRLGSGRQYFPSVSLTDWVRAVAELALSATATGAYNLTAPTPATNAEFTAAVAKALHRPAVIPVPGFALRTVGGELGRAMVGSLRAVPRRLLDTGFVFEHPTVEAQVRAAFAG